MLYNPHTRVPSLESMVAWLETKNSNETYNWSNSATCACAQYAKDKGVYDDWRAYDDSRLLWHALNELARGQVGDKESWTFGKLLKRVRETMPV